MTPDVLAAAKAITDKSPVIVPESAAVPIAPPIDGAVLLDKVSETMRHHLVLQDDDYKKIALFAAHAHATAAAQHSPRLAVIAPTIGCGKTTTLKVLSCLTPNALFCSDVSPAALYRTTGAAQSTLIFDEAHSSIAGKLNLCRLLNAGFSRAGAKVARAYGVLDVFAATVLALVGDLPESLRDRSIVIPIKRKLPKEVVAPFDAAALETLAELNTQLATFAKERHNELAAANPIMPDGVTNRHADKWEPLLAIADVAGGHWPQTARSLALRTVIAEEAARSPGELVLSDLRGIFATEKADRLPSEYITESLSELEDRPWAGFSRGRPITPQQLAHLLKPFKIGPRTVRFADFTAKGYHLEDFADAFERYL